MRKLALLLVSMMMVTCTFASDWYWTGGVSTNWADLSNWNSASDGTGSVPSLVDDLQGNDLWLFTTGTYLPSNQNINDLEVDELVFDSTLTSFAIDGLSIQLNNRINVSSSPADNQTLTFKNDIIRNSNNTWNNGSKVTLVMEGAVGETGGSRKHDASGNTVEFHGPVTLSGGFQNRTSRASFFGMDTTGSLPTTVDPDYFWTSWGSFLFSKPAGAEAHEYEFDSNVGFYTENGFQFYVDEWTSISLDGVISESGAGKYVQKQSDGRLCLNGDNAFTGHLGIHKGMIQLNGTITTNSYVDISHGGLDLAGNSVGRTIRFGIGYGGYLGSGAIRNSNVDKTSFVTSNITQLVPTSYGGNEIQFGGPGDIVLTGDITDSKTVYYFSKTGAGSLTVAGASSFGGATLVRSGEMIFDYSLDNSEKLSDTKEVELNGDFTISGNETADTEETIGDLKVGYILNTIQNAVNITAKGFGGNSASLFFDDFTCYASSSVDFSDSYNGVIKTLSAVNDVNVGVLAMRSTYNGSTFAKVGSLADGGGYYTIEGMADEDYVTEFDSDTRFESVELSGNVFQTMGWPYQTVAALRFDTPADTALNIKYDLKVLGESTTDWNYSGAILVTPDVGEFSSIIEGTGSLNGHGQPGTLFVHQFNTNAPLQINCSIIPNNTITGRNLVKSGFGELILTNSLNGFDALNIYDGQVTVTSIDDIGVYSAAGSGRSGITIASATLKYIGDGDSSDREITIRGNAVVDASGSGKLILDNTTPITTDDGSDHILTLTGSGEGEIAGVLDLEVGQLVKAGTGTWTLSGASNVNKFWGGADVQGGTLVVDSTLGFDVKVSDGGTLAGTGNIVNDLDIAGTLSVDLGSGFLTVAGDVNIDGGTLAVVGDCEIGEICTIISANSITGTFATVEEGYIVTYNDTDIVVELAPPMGTLLIIQ